MQMECKMNYFKKIALSIWKKWNDWILFWNTEIKKRRYSFYFKTVLSRFWGKKGTQAIVVKNKITNIEEITMLPLKTDVFLFTDLFRNYIDTCKSAYGINPL